MTEGEPDQVWLKMKLPVGSHDVVSSLPQPGMTAGSTYVGPELLATGTQLEFVETTTKAVVAKAELTPRPRKRLRKDNKAIDTIIRRIQPPVVLAADSLHVMSS